MKNIIITLFSVLFLTSAYADMSKSDKDKAWECSGIYMANYSYHQVKHLNIV